MKSESLTAFAFALVIVLGGSGVWIIIKGDSRESFQGALAGNSKSSAPSRLISEALKKSESSMNVETRGVIGQRRGNSNRKNENHVPSISGIASNSNFDQHLLAAVLCEDFELTSAIISEAMQTASGVERMKHFFADGHFPLEARKVVSEVLMRNGSQDAVQVVLAAVVKEFKLGKSEDGGQMLSSLDIPVGVDGANGLLNVLLNQDGTENISYPLPIEVQSAVQKSLRRAPDSEEIGKCLAQRYSDFLSVGEEDCANELLDGVAHPAMLGELVAKADRQGEADEVSGLFDRLIATDDPGVVGAMARLVSKEPSLLANASEALFNWSFNHSQYAQSGWFAEYLNNHTLPAEQRVVAAYGLAGLIGKAKAGLALEKAISSESDHFTQQCFQTALESLQNAVNPDTSNPSPTK